MADIKQKIAVTPGKIDIWIERELQKMRYIGNTFQVE